MKKTVIVTGIIATLAAIAATVVLIVQIAAGIGVEKIILDENNTTVESTAQFTDLHPGDSVSKIYDVTCAKEGTLRLTFQTGEKTELLPYLTVTVTFDEEEAYKGKLQDLLTKKLEQKIIEKCEAVITYTLPESVGNEAQNAALDLKIEFGME